MSFNATEKLQRALILTQQGRHPEAELLCKEVLETNPRHPEALHALGLISLQRGALEDGIDLIRRSVRENPRQPIAYLNIGVAQLRAGRAAEALTSMERGLRIAPKSVELLCGRGRALLHAARPEQALESFATALSIKPEHGEGLEGRAHALGALQRHDEALTAFERALQRQPHNAVLLNGRGIILQRLNRSLEALADFENALVLRPDYLEALCNRGFVLHTLGRDGEALVAYDRALAIRPGFVSALLNRADALLALQRHEDAAAAFSAVLHASPDHDFVRGERLQARMAACLWDGYEQEAATVVEAVKRGTRASRPFPVLSITDSPEVQHKCAQLFVSAEYPPASQDLSRGARYGHDKLRLAYLSADFHEHATPHLVAELFELHDRQLFDLTLVSFGPDDGSAMRRRLASAADRFVDARLLSDGAVAQLLRELEIDIAVDLKGFTHQARTRIFALRPAPLQVNYLGYPGTVGASYVDYIIADRCVIPPSQQAHYTEKVAYLPHCYQANDSTCSAAEALPQRSELGLPDEGFVFCCFNAPYKITPRFFDVWMRLLGQVSGSVLWLLQENAGAAERLRLEAARRGIEPGRLVFAQRANLADHLARQRHADLFLDTLPVNAHTTASDALRMGVPLLTCAGDAFAGRVAASLLQAIGLSELATTSLADYERMALELATSPVQLRELRARLERNRSTSPLFDTARFRRYLEEAYRLMIDRHQQGLPPAGFSVPE